MTVMKGCPSRFITFKHIYLHNAQVFLLFETFLKYVFFLFRLFLVLL